MTTVENNGGSVHNVILDAQNDGVSVSDIVANDGNGCIYGRGECLLGAKSQQLLLPK